MDLGDDLPPPSAPSPMPHGGMLLHAIEAGLTQAPLRHWQAPGGYTMSVAMNNCGELGRVSPCWLAKVGFC